MSGTRPKSSLATHRDAVERLITGGEAFSSVEDAIDEADHLTVDEKAALWLFAFSLRDPSAQQLDARANLALLQ
jgi:hypothetical protein